MNKIFFTQKKEKKRNRNKVKRKKLVIWISGGVEWTWNYNIESNYIWWKYELRAERAERQTGAGAMDERRWVGELGGVWQCVCENGF